jgi:sec-independent protein translocase protein TatB
MNLFGVGPAEMIVILVVALIFVGPERLPKLAADLARTIREIRKYTGSLAAEFNEVVQELEKETQAETTEWKEIGQGLADVTKSVTDQLTGARSDASGSPAASAAPRPGPSVTLDTPPPANGASPGGSAATPQPIEESR